MTRIIAIIKKELLLDARQKNLILALILYTVTNSYVAYKAFFNMPKMSWNSVFLIIFLYIGLNTILKSFGGRYSNRYLHYYSYYNPVELLIAKIIYNFVLLFILSAFLGLILLLFTNHQMADWSLFLLSLLAGCFGISCCYSVISLMSVKSNTNATIFSVLALPLAFPILLTMLKLNANSLGLINDTDIYTDVLILGAIAMMFLSISLVVFPSLWRS